MKKYVGLLLVTLCAPLMMSRTASADDPAAVIARWDAAWANVHDFYDGCHAQISKGNTHEDRIYQIWFKKPMNLRTEVVKGNRGGDTGSVAVYTGGDKVVGHQGGMLSGISLSLGLDNSKTTSVRGGRITDLQFGRHLDVIHTYQTGKAPMEITTGVVGGHAVTILTCRSDNKDFIAGNNDIARDVFSYDNVLNVPLEWRRYETSGTEVVNVSYYDIKVNIGVTDNAFQVRTHMTAP